MPTRGALFSCCISIDWPSATIGYQHLGGLSLTFIHCSRSSNFGEKKVVLDSGKYGIYGSTILKCSKWDMQPAFSEKQKSSSTKSAVDKSVTVGHSGTYSTLLSSSSSSSPLPSAALISLLSLNTPGTGTSLSMSTKSGKLTSLWRESVLSRTVSSSSTLMSKFFTSYLGRFVEEMAAAREIHTDNSNS